MVMRITAWMAGMDWPTARALTLSTLPPSLSSESKQIVKAIQNELLKIKPDQRFLVESGFRFASGFGKKVVLVMDNADELLGLNNYPQIKDVMAIITSLNTKNVLFAAATSSAGFAADALKGFHAIDIRPLDKKETAALARKTAALEDTDALKDKDTDALFSLTGGLPLYVSLLAKEYSAARSSGIAGIEETFIISVLQSGKALHDSCALTLTESLSRARGQTLLKSAIAAVASQKKSRLTDIGKKIYRSAPVTKSLLERLLSVGLVAKEDNMFSIPDPVLRIFIRYASSMDNTTALNAKIIAELKKELEAGLDG